MNKLSTLYLCSYNSPCGVLILGAFQGEICLCKWQKDSSTNAMITHFCSKLNAKIRWKNNEIIDEFIIQLNEYFCHQRTQFSLSITSLGTYFQQQVWNEVKNIAYGETLSYAQLAKNINNKRAVRAVANANRRNPLCLLVPCHKVIGSNHKLVGYAGGLKVKQFLLNLECQETKK